jgi:hypothetical protein
MEIRAIQETEERKETRDFQDQRVSQEKKEMLVQKENLVTTDLLDLVVAEMIRKFYSIRIIL